MEISYDRGTLLISYAPLDWDSDSIPGILWDPRVDAYRAPARLYAVIQEKLVREGTPFKDRVRENSFVPHFPTPPGSCPSFAPIKPRPWSCGSKPGPEESLCFPPAQEKLWPPSQPSSDPGEGEPPAPSASFRPVRFWSSGERNSKNIAKAPWGSTATAPGLSRPSRSRLTKAPTDISRTSETSLI